jgi:hypothetical protein
MKQILNNLMRKPGRANVCLITKKIGPNSYAVTDETGRVFNADSVVAWSIGEPVLVKNRNIIGRAVQQSSITSFEV